MAINPEGLALFKRAERLNFTLLADTDGKAAKAFGVPAGKGGSIDRFVKGEKFTLTRGVTSKLGPSFCPKTAMFSTKTTRSKPQWTVRLFLTSSKKKTLPKMTTSLSGKERGKLKSLAKTRPVDLKVGKKGITENLLCRNKTNIGRRLAPQTQAFPGKTNQTRTGRQNRDQSAREPHSHGGQDRKLFEDRSMKKSRYHLKQELAFPILQPPTSRAKKYQAPA